MNAKQRAGTIVEAKNRKGQVVFLFDTAKVPSNGASLKTRAAFAVAYLQRAVGGTPMSLRTFKLAIAWLAEAVAEWGGAAVVEKRVRRVS